MLFPSPFSGFNIMGDWYSICNKYGVSNMYCMILGSDHEKVVTEVITEDKLMNKLMIYCICI